MSEAMRESGRHAPKLDLAPMNNGYGRFESKLHLMRLGLNFGELLGYSRMGLLVWYCSCPIEKHGPLRGKMRQGYVTTCVSFFFCFFRMGSLS